MLEKNYTIIIPHYNIPDLLMRCLNSIPNRTDLQIIVVDDNSEGSECYVQKYNWLDRNDLEFYVTEDKLGAGHVRNVALPYIKGKKVIFADADDFFDSQFNDILNDYVDDNTDLVYFNTNSCLSNDISIKTNRTKDALYKIYEETGKYDHFLYRYTEPWGKIYSTRLIKENNIYFDETKVSNDQMFSIKTAYSAKSIKIDKRCLYWVTTREGSLSYKPIDTIEKLLIRIDVNARVQVFLSQRGISFYPMNVFAQMVNLLHRAPLSFILVSFKLHKLGISIIELYLQIIRERVLDSSKRHKLDSKKSAYGTM